VTFLHVVTFSDHPWGICMRAYQLEELGRPDGIVLRTRPDPQPGARDIVVRLHASSINRRDLMILAKTYPLPSKPNIVPLSDGAGEVVAIGSAVSRFKIGDRVTGSYFPKWRTGRLPADGFDQLGCTVDGMASELAMLDEQWAVPLASHLTWEEGACLSCAAVTAWNSLFGGTPLRPGQTVLTLGTGDVSLFTVLFARLMGARVIATTSSEDKAGKLREWGAHEVVNYAKTPAWGSAVRELTNNEGVDLVVETMGPVTIEQSLIAAARHSEIALLIWKSDSQPDVVLPTSAYGPKLANIRRLFVGSRTDLEGVMKAMSLHKLRPVIDRVFGFDQLHEAYRYFESRAGLGKIVLRHS
jgi:NADPH:quinone reductase-like Zn-dependent oxidoreductase